MTHRAIEPTASEGEVIDIGDENVDESLEQDLVEDELLVEEISIDGMCGVY